MGALAKDHYGIEYHKLTPAGVKMSYGIPPCPVLSVFPARAMGLLSRCSLETAHKCFKHHFIGVTPKP